MQLLGAENITLRMLVVRGLIGVLLIGLIVGGMLGYRPVMHRYAQWKHARVLEQARGFIVQRDFSNARMALQVALATGPADRATLDVLATMLDDVGSAQVLTVRRRLVELAPDRVEERAALIISAVRLNDLNAAGDALREIPPAQTSEPVALQAALAFAIASNNLPAADAMLAQLKDVSPDNDTLQVMQALLRLRHPDPDEVAAARAKLEAKLSDPSMAAFINRRLMADAMLRRDFAEARRRAELVLADPQSTFNDRLNLANIEINAEKQPVKDVFAKLSTEAKTSAETIEAARWLVMVGQPELAAKWLDGLPAERSEGAGVATVRAEVAAALGDWWDLQSRLADGAWGAMPRGLLQLVFAARVCADQGSPILQKELWAEARAASRSPAQLILLYRLASIWRWDDQVESTLWAINKADPSTSWAHDMLFNRYRLRKDAAGMKAIMDTGRLAAASLPRYTYDWALLTLLTSRTITWTSAKQSLEALYEREPTNAFYATGYAFALAQSGRGEEALAVVAKLSEKALGLSSRSPYLAYIYGVGRDREGFERSLRLRPPDVVLLPEEKALFTLGQDALDHPVRSQQSEPSVSDQGEMPDQ